MKRFQISALRAVLLALTFLLPSLFVQGAGSAFAPQFFVVFPPGLSPALSRSIFPKCLELVTNVPPGSSITFAQAIDFSEIAAFSVAGPPDEVRLQDVSIARAVLQLRKHLYEVLPKETNFQGQLQLPRLVDEIVARRSAARKCVLILVGDPRLDSIYPAEQAWSMKSGLVPSDGVLRAPYPQIPWGVKGRTQLRGTTVHWLVDRRDWRLSSTHEERVKRFLHLWFKLQGAEGLCSFSTDPDRVFENAGAQLSTPVVRAEMSPDLSITMLADPVAPTLTTNRNPALELSKVAVSYSPPAVRPGPHNIPGIPSNQDLIGLMNRKSDLLFSNLSSNQMGIASIWFSDDPKADVDFWVRPRNPQPADDGKSEISFSVPKTPAGFLHQDLTRVTMNSPDPDLIATAWEAVTLDQPILEEMSIWLNLFSTSKPVAGVVRIVWQGEKYDFPFRFDLSVGDKAGGRDARDQSPFWFKIDFLDRLRAAPRADENKT